jgi:DeoC/LacD family aldolase
MMNGKQHRMSRFIHRDTGRGVIVALDHGLTSGPLDGLNRVQDVAGWAHYSAINAFIAHKGMMERLVAARLTEGRALVVHLNGMTTLALAAHKALLTTLESALRLGADAVSVDLLFDAEHAETSVRTLAAVVDDAARYGPRGSWARTSSNCRGLTIWPTFRASSMESRRLQWSTSLEAHGATMPRRWLSRSGHRPTCQCSDNIRHTSRSRT